MSDSLESKLVKWAEIPSLNFAGPNFNMSAPASAADSGPLPEAKLNIPTGSLLGGYMMPDSIRLSPEADRQGLEQSLARANKSVLDPGSVQPWHSWEEQHPVNNALDKSRDFLQLNPTLAYGAGGALAGAGLGALVQYLRGKSILKGLLTGGLLGGGLGVGHHLMTQHGGYGALKDQLSSGYGAAKDWATDYMAHRDHVRNSDLIEQNRQDTDATLQAFRDPMNNPLSYERYSRVAKALSDAKNMGPSKSHMNASIGTPDGIRALLPNDEHNNYGIPDINKSSTPPYLAM